MLVRLLADGTLVLILAIALPLLYFKIRHDFWRVTPLVVMAGLTSLVIAKVMSLVYQPAIARPFIELGVEPGAAYIDNPGFPSDHALFATVVVIGFYAVTKNRNIALLLALLILVMGIARVVALVHSPLDVVAGVLAGLIGAVWYRKLTK